MQIAADTTLVTTRRLQILATDCSQQLTFPRTQKFVTHTREALLSQEVYQILAGYPGGNDAQQLRHDPLFQTLVDVWWVAKFAEAKCFISSTSSICKWGGKASRDAVRKAGDDGRSATAAARYRAASPCRQGA